MIWAEWTEWPAIVIALATHLPSLLFGQACVSLGGSAGWMVESLSFNKYARNPSSAD